MEKFTDSQKQRASQLFDGNGLIKFQSVLTDAFGHVDAARTAYNSIIHGKDAAAGSLVAQNRLTYIDPKILTQQYPENALLNSGVTIDNTGGTASIIQTVKGRGVGVFKNVEQNAANAGLISMAADTKFLRIAPYMAFSIWTEFDVQKAANENFNLVNEFVSNHATESQRMIEQLCLLGNYDGQTFNEGLLNAAGVFVDTTTPLSTYANNTQQLHDKFAAFLSAQMDAANGVEAFKANVVLMAPKLYNTLQSSSMVSSGSNASILKILQGNYPTVQFRTSALLGGADGQLKAVAFSTSDQVMKIRIPQPLTFSAQTQSGFTTKVESYARVGGLDLFDVRGVRVISGF